MLQVRAVRVRQKQQHRHIRHVECGVATTQQRQPRQGGIVHAVTRTSPLHPACCAAPHKRRTYTIKVDAAGTGSYDTITASCTAKCNVRQPIATTACGALSEPNRLACVRVAMSS